jgi:hypothetical protein
MTPDARGIAEDLPARAYDARFDAEGTFPCPGTLHPVAGTPGDAAPETPVRSREIGT